MIAAGSDLLTAPVAGWRDLRAAPLYGAGIALPYVVGGWIMLAAVRYGGQKWLVIPASVGFPILGPFIACGFQGVCRRLEMGEPLVASKVLGVTWGEQNCQIPMMSSVIVMFFLFWYFPGHMIFGLFLGTTTLTNVSTSSQVFVTPQGLMMVAFGTAVVAGFLGLLLVLPLFWPRQLASLPPSGGLTHPQRGQCCGSGQRG